MFPLRQIRMMKTYLCIGTRNNLSTQHRHIPRFIWQNFKSKLRRINNHKTITTKGGIYNNGSVTFYIERNLQAISKACKSLGHKTSPIPILLKFFVVVVLGKIRVTAKPVDHRVDIGSF